MARKAKAGAKADRGGSATAAAAKQDVLAAHTAAAAAPSYNNMAAEIGLHTPMLGIPPTSYTFEFMLLLFIVVHVIIQNFNLNGYNTHQYNMFHIIFTCLFFTKRWGWGALYSSWGAYSKVSAGMIIVAVMWLVPALAIVKVAVELYHQHDLQTFLFLFYPAMFYLSLFGHSISGNSVSWLDGQPTTRGDAIIGGAVSAPNDGPKPAAIILNYRYVLKHIVYGAIEAGYYAGFLPVRFLINNYAVYDTKMCALLGIFVTINTGLLLMLNTLDESSQSLCSNARALGFWAPVAGQKGGGMKQWTPNSVWEKGSRVVYNKKVYVASGESSVCVEPGDTTAKFFYTIFRNPKQHSENLVFIQIGMCVVQLVMLLFARRKDAVIGWGTIILFSYAVLFKALSVRRKIVKG